MASMTKQHFEAIADVLRTQYNMAKDRSDESDAAFIYHVAQLLSARLQGFNGRFDPPAFCSRSNRR